MVQTRIQLLGRAKQAFLIFSNQGSSELMVEGGAREIITAKENAKAAQDGACDSSLV